MKKNILNLSLLACLATPIAVHAAPPAFVTSGANDGVGSVKLRGTTVGDEKDFNTVDEI